MMTKLVLPGGMPTTLLARSNAKLPAGESQMIPLAAAAPMRTRKPPQPMAQPSVNLRRRRTDFEYAHLLAYQGNTRTSPVVLEINAS
jgi:hypothetical protein